MRRGKAEAAARLETAAVAGFATASQQLQRAAELMRGAVEEHLHMANAHDVEAAKHRNLADVADESAQRHDRIRERLEALLS